MQKTTSAARSVVVRTVEAFVCRKLVPSAEVLLAFHAALVSHVLNRLEMAATTNVGVQIAVVFVCLRKERK